MQYEISLDLNERGGGCCMPGTAICRKYSWQSGRRSSQSFDFNLFYAWNTNHVDNSLASVRDTDYLIQTIGGKMNVILPGNFVLRSDLRYQSYRGISDAFNTTYTLWNATIAKKLFKYNTGEIAIKAYEILRQNQRVNQEVTAAYFEETNSLVLQQYFMLSASYTLRNFKG